MPTSDLRTKSLDERITYVVKHPIRVEALAILNERTASTAEIAALMGVPVKRISHHIRDLFDTGCIEIVKSVQRRGAQEHYYRASLRPNISDAEWGKLSREARHEISGLVFQAIFAEGLGALRAGTLDSRTNRHMSWRVLNLDEDGWLELVKEKAESLEETEAIQARSYRRMVESGDKGFFAITAALAFERAKPGRSRRHHLID
jgi:Bacterial regulatory protein, arsR family